MRIPRLILAALAATTALLAVPSALAENQSVKATDDDVYVARLVAVKPGESVSFTNTGGEHNVVWNDGKVPPMPTDSVEPSQWPAGGVSRTFQAPGRYRYYCTLHGDPKSDFGMSGYVYVNPAGLLPPAVSGVTASTSPTKVTVKFRSTRAGKAKVTFFKKVGRKFVRNGTASFSARKGLNSKQISKALPKGSYRIDVVVTDSDRLASDVKSKTFKVTRGA